MSQLNDNIARAQDYMKRFREQGVLNHINGESVPADSGKTFETISPVDLAPLADVAHGGASDIDRAVKAAEKAFKTWSKTPGKERREILIKVAEAIEARAEEIAFTECMDTGQSLRFMSKAAVRGAANFRFFADRAPQAEDGLSLRNDTQMNVTSKRPLGPIGVITPWNTPFMLSTWKIAPALASGCTVVHKPAEFSPMTAKLLVEIAEEAGLPKGVLNLVNGMGEDAGKALTEHPGIKAVAFVGESRTGQLIMAQAAPTLKRFHFELGGKNPVIVFDDADIERAVNAATFMIYSLNGERCTSSSRLLVQESIYEEVTRRVAEVANGVKVGHPLDPDTVVGPLIHPEHEEKVLSYFDKAREEGATIAAGGEKAGDEGCFVRPTLFTNATNDMTVAQEEIFGPVLTAISFKDEEEALRLANDTQYGLAAYLWTNDLDRAMRLTDELEAGMIWVNSENVRHLESPFGGVKSSGIGRDGGDWSFDFYMETVNVSFPRKAHKVPKLG
ncbi:5-carboxymethyl-2-hydroxymuconate semialdehyde dehydrogenase [Larsenimonas suaedae]|uniref:5-carboxymethyl-2-hydroxymuconate semialdehyde dehydrogenase n=1 Tax=Larsenimonas suaedae TaxID=1851019 RepID=A0ABU1GW25_9GAMM|nr:5-carboxymethyl-2-hydroxymuconate semialdehyde dehydrogenase [Larsenimonas suaedae]MCM2973315.1 5-carboxymethyl-2-hydroxymuconate semialdehyde dehydrogenase [Larsenimonas suaedae]MDR5896208.1 5-carboxymethyl-2-hydroxymuconate semialdehyde dehydrogenase [Larsenimonas suaedae]